MLEPRPKPRLNLTVLLIAKDSRREAVRAGKRSLNERGVGGRPSTKALYLGSCVPRIPWLVALGTAAG